MLKETVSEFDRVRFALIQAQSIDYLGSRRNRRISSEDRACYAFLDALSKYGSTRVWPFLLEATELGAEICCKYLRDCGDLPDQDKLAERFWQWATEGKP